MLDLATLIADPLYQVNLILLMLQPSMGSPVKPILRNANYKLAQIEPSLPLPSDLNSSLSKDKILVRNPVSPDLVIESNKKEYLILECKRTMFGSNPQPGKSDGQIKQARSCLLQTPKILAGNLLLLDEDVSVSLLYLSRHDPSHEQTKGLKEIAEQLNAAKYETVDYGLLGLSYDAKSIYLNSKYSPSFLPKALRSIFKGKPVIVHEIDDPDNDPRTYYPIPWMPGSSDTKETDKYNENAFGSAILQQATINIATTRPPKKVKLKLESLINLATNGYYQNWRDPHVRSKLIKNTRDLLNKILHSVPIKPDIVYLGGEKAIEIDIQDASTQSQIIEAMRRWKYDEWLDFEQPELFPIL